MAKSEAIVLDTSMDYQKIEKDFKSLEKKTSSLIDKYNKACDSIKSQELAVQKLKTQLELLQSGEKTPSSVKNLQTELKKAEKELSNYEKQYNEITSRIGDLNIKIDTESSLGDLTNVSAVENYKQELSNLDVESLNLADKMENARDKVEQLNISLSSFNPPEIDELTSKLELAESKLQETKNGANETKNAISELLNQKTSSLGASFGSIGEKVSEVSSKIDSFKKRITKMITTVAVFNLMRKGLTSLRNSFTSLLKTDDTFSSSLNQIKANLMTAFAPIYNYVLPAINSLMKGLTKVTGAIATFVSNLFGISTSEAKKQAEELTDALDDTSDSSDSASGSLASFDKLNVISQDSSSSSSSSSIDYSGDIESSSALENILNRIKESLSGIDFTNLNTALQTFKDKLSSFGDIVGGALWWVWENLLVPLAQWTIQDVLPAFLDILSGAFEVLSAVCEKLKPIWEWLWDNFLQPIAEWTGGIIVDVLNGIADALEWVADNEIAVTILTSLAVAIGLVATAIGVYNVAMALCNVVTGIFSGIMAVLTSPITLVILAITALIAIIVLCVQHWDEIKAKAVEVWNKIVDTFSSAWEWFKSSVVDPIKNVFVNLWSALKSGATGAWEGIKSVFSSVATFFKNIFTNAWTAVKNVFSTGGKIFSGLKDGIVSAFKTIVNAIIKGINKVIATPFNTINTMLNKIRSIKILGAQPFINLWKESPLSVPQIPYLAEGAVIPARHEFAAVLGDQKHGTNIETPESEMARVFDERLANFFSKYSGLSDDTNEVVLKNWNLYVQLGSKTAQKFIIDEIRAEERQSGTTLLLN